MPAGALPVYPSTIGASLAERVQSPLLMFCTLIPSALIINFTASRNERCKAINQLASTLHAPFTLFPVDHVDHL